MVKTINQHKEGNKTMFSTDTNTDEKLWSIKHVVTVLSVGSALVSQYASQLSRRCLHGKLLTCLINKFLPSFSLFNMTLI